MTWFIKLLWYFAFITQTEPFVHVTDLNALANIAVPKRNLEKFTLSEADSIWTLTEPNACWECVFTPLAGRFPKEIQNETYVSV